MLHTIKRHPILAFYLLAFALSWAIKIPVTFSLSSNILLRFLPSLLPAVAALVVTALIAGRRGVSALWRSLNPGGTTLWLYAVVLLGPVVLDALALGINLLAGQPAPQWYNPGWRLLQFLPALFFAVGEELGWRGFALKHLQARYSALTSSLIVGTLWALWHAPEVFAAHLPFTTTVGLEAVSLLQFLALSLLMTWAVNSSKGRIALACLLHVDIGLLPRFLPDAYTQNGTLFSLLFTLLLCVAAIAVVVIYGATNLARRPRTVSDPEQANPSARISLPVPEGF